MYLAEAEEIFDYWQDSPPTYQAVGLIARMLGWEPQPRAANDDPPDMPELSPEMAAAIGKAAGVPALAISLDDMRERNKRLQVELARKRAAKSA